MNQFLLVINCAGFLFLPLVVLCLRAGGMKWFTGPVALCAVAILGWFFVNAGLYFYFETLEDRLLTYGNDPPPQLLEEFASDGAKQVFAALFGGFYALIYYLPFALIYETARGVKWFYSAKIRRRGSA